MRMVSYLTRVHAGSSQPLNSHAICRQDSLGYWRGIWRPLRVIPSLTSLFTALLYEMLRDSRCVLPAKSECWT